jgi:hypothetical protein
MTILCPYSTQVPWPSGAPVGESVALALTIKRKDAQKKFKSAPGVSLDGLSLTW